jgi:hypothetical protein
MRQQLGVSQPTQLGEEHPVGVTSGGQRRGTQRHPRLAYATGTGHRHQARRFQQPGKPGKLGATAHEPGNLRGQPNGALLC